MPELLTRKQVAQLLQVRPLTVARWEKEGRLPAPVRLGANTVRHSRTAIEQFVAHCNGKSAVTA